MKKYLFIASIFLLALSANAQVEVLKFVGKKGSQYGIGFGAGLKFGFPVSEAATATFDANVVLASVKHENFERGIALIPIKIGYLYTLNQTGSGVYIEPQVGYCVYGAVSNDEMDKKVTGFDWAIGAGYLFETGRRTQYGIGLRYETVYFNGGPASFIALRLASFFSFKSRESY